MNCSCWDFDFVEAKSFVDCFCTEKAVVELDIVVVVAVVESVPDKLVKIFPFFSFCTTFFSELSDSSSSSKYFSLFPSVLIIFDVVEEVETEVVGEVAVESIKIWEDDVAADASDSASPIVVVGELIGTLALSLIPIDIPVATTRKMNIAGFDMMAVLVLGMVR